MKRSQIQELKNKPVPELQKHLKEIQEKMRVLKFNLSSDKGKNVKEFKNLKKETARILTFINQQKNG